MKIMIKAQKNGNIITVKTGIPAVYAGEKLVFVDDKKDEVYRVEAVVDMPYVSKFGMGCNAVIDDELACVFTVDVDDTNEQIKKAFGYGLVAANAYIPQIIDGKAAEAELLASVFEF